MHKLLAGLKNQQQHPHLHDITMLSSIQRMNPILSRRCVSSFRVSTFRRLSKGVDLAKQFSIVEKPDCSGQRLHVTLPPGEAIQTEVDTLLRSEGPPLKASPANFNGTRLWTNDLSSTTKMLRNEGETTSKLQLGSVLGDKCSIHRVDLSEGQELNVEVGGLLCVPQDVVLEQHKVSMGFPYFYQFYQMQGPGPVTSVGKDL